MSITVLGKETLVAIKAETAGSEGTPVACGAGNQVDVLSGVKIKSDIENEVDDDTLAPELKETWQVPTPVNADIPLAPHYQGLEIWAGLALGAIAAPAQQANPKAYATVISEATLSRAATFAAAKGDDKAAANILEVIELSGLKVEELTFDQSDLSRLKVDAKSVAKTRDLLSTTNTAATMDDVTFGDASYPTNLANFGHLKRGGVWIAAQDSDTFSASNAASVSKVKIGYKGGIGGDIKDNYSTAGREVPIQSGKPSTSIEMTLFRDNTASKAIYDLIRNNQKLKSKVHFKSDKGIPGCVISASSPSTDISGSSNSKLKFTFTHILTGQTESKEITLSLTGLNTGNLIAAAIQAAIRAATATNTLFQEAYDKCICNYNSVVSGKYYCSVDSNTLFDIDNAAASSVDLATELKLSTGASGTAPDHVPFQIIFMHPELIFTPPDDEFSMGMKPVNLKGFALTSYGANTPVGFTASDEPLLGTSMSAEAIRIIIINRNSTSAFA